MEREKIKNKNKTGDTQCMGCKQGNLKHKNQAFDTRHSQSVIERASRKWHSLPKAIQA